MPLIDVTMIEGRTDEQKRRLIAALTDGATRVLGAPPETVRVIVREVPAGHWGIGGRSKEEIERSAQESSPTDGVDDGAG